MTKLRVAVGKIESWFAREFAREMCSCGREQHFAVANGWTNFAD
jgi:hypothetical protein